MKTTQWLERGRKGFEPQVLLLFRIEDLLVAKPVMICYSFQSLHPDVIDMETDIIHPAAHLFVDQITQPDSFRNG